MAQSGHASSAGATGTLAGAPGADPAWVGWHGGARPAEEADDGRFLCSTHHQRRTPGNVLPDGAGGWCCRPNSPCLTSGKSRGTCPRDEVTGRRVDRPTAGDLRAAPPWLTH